MAALSLFLLRVSCLSVAVVIAMLAMDQPRVPRRFAYMAARIAVATLLLGVLTGVLGVSAHAASVPRGALPYRSDVIRAARSRWGIDAPVATFAGQIQTESAWHPAARSPVGAAGMAQFMPQTARWLCGQHPNLPPGCDVLSPAWAIQALVAYDLDLYRATPHAARCGRMWAALRGYNGGLGYWWQEWRIAGRPANLRLADRACGRGRRSARYCAENLSYPRSVLRFQLYYLEWGPGVCDHQSTGVK